jgi:hypothetical protein
MTEKRRIPEPVGVNRGRQKPLDGKNCWCPRRDLNPCYRRERPVS